MPWKPIAPIDGLLVADHHRQDRLAVPRRRLRGLAVHLVHAGLLVVVLAARHEPRADDRAVAVDGPHPLAGAAVHDTLARARVLRQRRGVGARGGDRGERVAGGVLRAGGRRRRAHDQRRLVGPDAQRQGRLAADDAVDEHALVGALQLADRLLRGAVERAAGGAAEDALGDQRLLDARDALAGVAEPGRADGHRAVTGGAGLGSVDVLDVLLTGCARDRGGGAPGRRRRRRLPDRPRWCRPSSAAAPATSGWPPAPSRVRRRRPASSRTSPCRP